MVKKIFLDFETVLGVPDDDVLPTDVRVQRDSVLLRDHLQGCRLHHTS